VIQPRADPPARIQYTRRYEAASELPPTARNSGDPEIAHGRRENPRLRQGVTLVGEVVTGGVEGEPVSEADGGVDGEPGPDGDVDGGVDGNADGDGGGEVGLVTVDVFPAIEDFWGAGRWCDVIVGRRDGVVDPAAEDGA
jgi:hypothetical protein